MTKEQTQEIAFMRYSVIAPLISELQDRFPSHEAYFRDASAKGVTAPDGSIKHYAPTTIKKWYNRYNQSGFDALIPSSRSDLGKPGKLDDELQEQIRYLKNNYPRISAAAIFRQLRDNGSIRPDELSESIVNRYLNALALEMKTTSNQDMRRYERPHINEVWCGDSSVGPYLKTDDGKKHRIYMIALIDDASRFIVGIDVFFNDNFVNLMSVMKSAVAKYGRPQMFNFDNGSSYKNKQMELLAARLGSVIHYDRPYTPTQKAKIERWFRTCKDQWMAALDIRAFRSLDELRGNLMAYVNKYNQSTHSSLKGKTPQERFFSEPERICRLFDEEISRNFLLEIERRVSADSVITIEQIEYEAIDIAIEKTINGLFPNALLILKSIDGIGPVLAAGIIAEIGDVQAFHSSDALAKYAGLTWSRNDSGDFISEDNHMQKAGNTYLRYYLGEAANSVRRYVPEYGSYYAKKYGEVSKHQHKRALALTSRKFVRLVFGLLVKNQLYTGERLDTELHNATN